jgi:hypothetical protein
MTKDRANNYIKSARRSRKSGDFHDAGELFTTAAYEWWGVQPRDGFGGFTADGTYSLLNAALCYKLAGEDGRCQNRCGQGILVAEDMHRWVHENTDPSYEYDRARRGEWKEFVGDFRTIAGDEEAAVTAYDEARSIYEIASKIDLEMVEEEQRWLMQFYRELIRGSGGNVQDWYDQRAKLTLPQWIDHKRIHLSRYYDRLLEKGKWAMG